MIPKSVLYIKTIILFILFVMTVIYLVINANLMLINTEELHSLVLFLNDMNPNSNLIEYISLLIIKLLFNVDIHDLSSFFKNINPLLN